MIINATVRLNDGADWVGVERKKNWTEGGPHIGGQQDVRVCCLP